METLRRPNRNSIWLLPEPRVRAEIQKIIDDLANRFNVAPFVPHLTLYFGPPSNRLPDREIARELARFSPPLQITGKELVCGDTFPRTFYLEFECSPALQALSDLAWSFHDSPPPGPLFAHMSFLYADLVPKERERLLAEFLDWGVGRQFVFDSTTFAAGDRSIETPQDVRGWKLHHDALLCGPEGMEFGARE